MLEKSLYWLLTMKVTPKKTGWFDDLINTYNSGTNGSSEIVSRSVVSDSLLPLGLQHTRLPCPSLSIGVCLNSYTLNRWYHPTITSFVIPFFSCPQSFPASGPIQWVDSLHQVTKVLEFQLLHQSFQWIFRVDFI